MATSTSVENTMKADGAGSRNLLSWQNILFGLSALVLLGVGIWMRLHQLGLPFDRDSYDEGVYWQSLRALSAGNGLYQQTFYSQPPFFLLSVYPMYILFGQSLWAARLGIALVSLTGLAGAFLLGKALAGRVGALAALLLLIVDPLYLAQSQTLQAEAPSAALSFLAVGLIYLWWERPDGITGICLAVLSTVALSLSILCKLLAISTLVPIGMLMLAHCWRIAQRKPDERLNAARSLIVGIVAFIVITLILLLPFVGSWQQFWHSVVTFHTDAGTYFKSTQASNLGIIGRLLLALTSCAALYGTIVALLRRDWRALPLIAWFLVTTIMLWRVVPLFPHHLVALTPPLVALAVLGIAPGTRMPRDRKSALSFPTLATVLSLLLILVTVGLNGRADLRYYRAQQQTSNNTVSTQASIIKDLQAATQPDQLVVTDAQFIVARADRSTPAALVDTSTVRIDTGYVTAQQIIQESARPEVHAVLIYTGRLENPDLAPFQAWLSQHFRQIKNYGGGKGLWIKVS